MLEIVAIAAVAWMQLTIVAQVSLEVEFKNPKSLPQLQMDKGDDYDATRKDDRLPEFDSGLAITRQNSRQTERQLHSLQK